MIWIDLILLAVIGVLVYFLVRYRHQLDASQKQAQMARIVHCTTRALTLAATNSMIVPRDGNGNPVDWFVVFKLPNHSKNCEGSCANCDCSGCAQPAHCDHWNSGNTAAGDRASGECYFYADSSNPSLQYYTDVGFGCLSDANSPLSQTMAQLTMGKWALWNDQGESSSCEAPHAHSKGAICYTSQGGFILNTSSPHWPNSDLQPMGCQATSNTEYAQHVFCFSVSSDTMNQWLQVAQNASLCITESSFLSTGPMQGGSTPAPLAIQTVAGTPITVMIKGSADVYLPWSLVAESVHAGLSVASWTSTSSGGTSGWGSSPNYNNGSEALKQITDISTPHGCFKSVYSYSHSKWAISNSGDWVIFGSMNMQDSQAKRGGDFYGFQNADLHSSLKGFIAATIDR